MKRAIVIHCWDGTPSYAWYPWLKKELENKGYQAQVPAMPETELPKQSKWVPKLAEVAGQPDEGLVLVGHSVGCITILRYLEGLPEGQKVGKCVFVAGFTDNLGFDELKNYFENEINWEKIKTHCEKFVAIYSDDDPYVPLKHADVFEEKLGAKVVIENKKGHFSGPVDDEESCVELPSALEAVIK